MSPDLFVGLGLGCAVGIALYALVDAIAVWLVKRTAGKRLVYAHRPSSLPRPRW